MSEHTNTPWEYYVATMVGDEIAVIHPQGEPDDYRICTVFDEAGGGTSPEANARHIVRCVNNHESLVEALENALEWIDAVPDETVLPAMPGFDRDLVDELLAALEAEKGGEL